MPVPIDRTIDGRDVLGMVTGKAKSPHDAVFWSSGGLSDLEKDPGGTKNLRRDYPNVVDELATMAQHWLETVKQM